MERKKKKKQKRENKQYMISRKWEFNVCLLHYDVNSMQFKNERRKKKVSELQKARL